MIVLDYCDASRLILLVAFRGLGRKGPLCRGRCTGPAAMNHWRTHFGRTLVDRRDQDRVHIMIVNTVDATAPLTSTGLMGGEHWFVAAWLVEPKPEGSCSGE